MGPPEPGPVYTVLPKFPASPAGQSKVAWALTILRPNAAAGLDNDRIALIQPDGTLDFYAKATYPDRLSPMVQQALLNGFEASGRIDAVAQEQDALHADYNLVTDIKDFRAHYAVVDGIPSITVALTAKLSTAHGRAIVGTFSTTKTSTASVNSAAAAAQALQQALSRRSPRSSTGLWLRLRLRRSSPSRPPRPANRRKNYCTKPRAAPNASVTRGHVSS